MCRHGDVVKLTIGGRIRDIDRCIAPIVLALNAGGVATLASCCGHGHLPGRIALGDGRELVVLPDDDDAPPYFNKFLDSIHDTEKANG